MRLEHTRDRAWVRCGPPVYDELDRRPAALLQSPILRAGSTECSTAGELEQQGPKDSVPTYTWDDENRMATVALPDGTRSTFTYDATGLRRQKREAGGITRFVWDGQNVLLETDGNGTTRTAYTQTPSLYGALVAQRRSGASSFYHFDALGSTMELSNIGGSGTDSYRYYAFGEIKAHTGTTTNPFGFVGRLGYYDEPGLALQYLRESAKGERQIDIPDRRTLLCSLGITLRLLLSLAAFCSVWVLPEHSVWEQVGLAMAGLGGSMGTVLLRSHFPPPLGTVQPSRGLVWAVTVMWGAATATAIFVPQYAHYAASALLASLAATSLLPALAEEGPHGSGDASR